jgi:hypothetical protein
MGRTSNAEIITKDRAHVHFELNVLVNDNFAAWFKTASPGERNDHGEWNGQNLNGLDPREILLAEHNPVAKFSLLNFIRSQTELCRVLVRATNFPYLKRYAALVLRNPVAEKKAWPATKSPELQRRRVRADAARGIRDQKPRKISAAFRQRGRGKGESLPQTGRPARRPLGAGQRRLARTGIADVLSGDFLNANRLPEVLLW